MTMCYYHDCGGKSSPMQRNIPPFSPPAIVSDSDECFVLCITGGWTWTLQKWYEYIESEYVDQKYCLCVCVREREREREWERERESESERERVRVRERVREWVSVRTCECVSEWMHWRWFLVHNVIILLNIRLQLLGLEEWIWQVQVCQADL